MSDPLAQNVSVVVPRATLREIFAECDRFDSHETGGALIGTYKGNQRSGLAIQVMGVIDAGPNARRTATSFFKDGEHQERIFRAIERQYPQVEHLGNWHTHHMNGYPTLSPGDRATYHKNVNSPKHNTDFFYAFLVTARTDKGYYTIRHFILFRDDPQEYEIPASGITAVERSVLWPCKRAI